MQDLARAAPRWTGRRRALRRGQRLERAEGELGAERQQHPGRPQRVAAEQREEPRAAGRREASPGRPVGEKQTAEVGQAPASAVRRTLGSAASTPTRPGHRPAGVDGPRRRSGRGRATVLRSPRCQPEPPREGRPTRRRPQASASPASSRPPRGHQSPPAVRRRRAARAPAPPCLTTAIAARSVREPRAGRPGRPAAAAERLDDHGLLDRSAPNSVRTRSRRTVGSGDPVAEARARGRPGAGRPRWWSCARVELGPVHGQLRRVAATRRSPTYQNAHATGPAAARRSTRAARRWRGEARCEVVQHRLEPAAGCVRSGNSLLGRLRSQARILTLKRGRPIAGHAPSRDSSDQMGHDPASRSRPRSARRAAQTASADVAPRHVGGVSRSRSPTRCNSRHRVRPPPASRVRRRGRSELGYRPSGSRPPLRTRRSRLLGLQPRALARHRRPRSSTGSCTRSPSRAQQHGSHLILCHADDRGRARSPPTADLLDTAEGRRLRAHQHPPRRPPYGVARRRERRAVLHLRPPRGPPTSTTPGSTSTARAGTRAAVEHLVAQGHRRIGFVGWPPGSGVGRRPPRRAGGGARARRGLPAGPQLPGGRPRTAWRGPRGRASGCSTLADPPTALVCASDSLALGVLRAPTRLRRPDLGVTGFDDSPVAALARSASPASQPAARAARPRLPRRRRGARSHRHTPPPDSAARPDPHLPESTSSPAHPTTRQERSRRVPRQHRTMTAAPRRTLRLAAWRHRFAAVHRRLRRGSAFRRQRGVAADWASSARRRLAEVLIGSSARRDRRGDGRRRGLGRRVRQRPPRSSPAHRPQPAAEPGFRRRRRPGRLLPVSPTVAGYAATARSTPTRADLENADDFYPNLREAFTVDDKFYCAPKDFSTLGAGHQPDAWEAAGLTEADVPTTWDELAPSRETLTTGEQVGPGVSPDYAAPRRLHGAGRRRPGRPTVRRWRTARRTSRRSTSSNRWWPTAR